MRLPDLHSGLRFAASPSRRDPQSARGMAKGESCRKGEDAGLDPEKILAEIEDIAEGR